MGVKSSWGWVVILLEFFREILLGAFYCGKLSTDVGFIPMARKDVRGIAGLQQFEIIEFLQTQQLEVFLFGFLACHRGIEMAKVNFLDSHPIRPCFAGKRSTHHFYNLKKCDKTRQGFLYSTTP